MNASQHYAVISSAGSSDVLEYSAVNGVYKLCHLYEMVGILSELDRSINKTLSDKNALAFYAFGRIYSPSVLACSLNHLRIHSNRLFVDADIMASNPLTLEEVGNIVHFCYFVELYQLFINVAFPLDEGSIER